MLFPPSSFTGKERDEETGYGYFGARYMDHELMTMWLSVDSMADKYPSISPYAYCAWNPLKLVDPKGMEIDDYRLDIKTGELRFFMETNDSRDCIHTGYYDESNEWISQEASFDCQKGILTPDKTVDNSQRHLIASDIEGIAFMANVSFACHKEMAAYAFLDGNKQSYEIFPWSDNDALNSRFQIPEKATYNTILYDIHTHCGTSDYTNDHSGSFAPSKLDKTNVASNGNWNHYILSIKNGLGQYNSNGNVPIVRDNLTVALLKYYRGNIKK